MKLIIFLVVVAMIPKFGFLPTVLGALIVAMCTCLFYAAIDHISDCLK